jgi:hypothetical protein
VRRQKIFQSRPPPLISELSWSVAQRRKHRLSAPQPVYHFEIAREIDFAAAQQACRCRSIIMYTQGLRFDPERLRFVYGMK